MCEIINVLYFVGKEKLGRADIDVDIVLAGPWWQYVLKFKVLVNCLFNVLC